MVVGTDLLVIGVLTGGLSIPAALLIGWQAWGGGFVGRSFGRRYGSYIWNHAASGTCGPYMQNQVVEVGYEAFVRAYEEQSFLLGAFTTGMGAVSPMLTGVGVSIVGSSEAMKAVTDMWANGNNPCNQTKFILGAFGAAGGATAANYSAMYRNQQFTQTHDPYSPPASAVSGRRGYFNPYSEEKWPRFELETITPVYESRVIHGRVFSGHALDQLRARGIPLSAVEQAIETGDVSRIPHPIEGFRYIYYDPVNKIQVVLGPNGHVITVYPRS